MQLVVLLRGVNVGGHRTFRPARLAAELRHLGAVNIGAAGTFVIRDAGSRASVRDELVRRLPFETEIMICSERDVAALMAEDFFANEPAGPQITRFVTVLARAPRSKPPMPMLFPPEGAWRLKVVAVKGRFLVGLYRREMRAIGDLARLDRLFGSPGTTRNWNTMVAIERVLRQGGRETR